MDLCCRVFYGFVLLLASQLAHASETFKRIGVDDGLPNATIYSITQDHAGFIWLTSTNSGLLRYDGYHFAEFPVLTETERKQQGSKDVGTLFIDKQQNMWAGTWGYGLSKIDGKTGALTRYVHDDRNSASLAGMQVQALMQDSRGYIWVGSTGGLNRIRPDGVIERLGVEKDTATLAHPRVWSIVEGLDGTIWIATSLGIQYWRDGEGFSELLQLFPNRSARDNEIRGLYRLGQDIWVATRFGVWHLDAQTKQLVEVPFFAGSTAPIVNVITSDAQGMLLVGTYNGMFRIDPQKRKYMSFRKQPALLPTVNVRAIFLDQSGVIWLGSRENGLYYARHSKSAFTSLQTILPTMDEEVFQQTTTAVAAHDDFIWLGTAAGVLEVDRQRETLRKLPTAGRVNALQYAPDGYVYVATDAGLLRQTPGGDLQPVEAPFQALVNVSANIRDIVLDQDGSFWLGLWGDGIVHWRADQQAVSYLKDELRQKIGDAVQALATDSTSTWIGTRYSGLFQLDKASGQVRAVTSADGLVLPSPDIQCIEPTQRGTLLICTATGLVIYDPKQKQQQLFDRRSGLPSENVFGAHMDPSGDIWIMSPKGLTQRKHDSARMITFTEQDGLVATELVFNAFFDDGQGTMYVGTIEGLSIVEPAYIWVNEVAPKVAVSNIRINNQQLAMHPSQPNTPTISLKPTDNAVEFEFAAFDFHDTSRNQFMYRLQGLEQDWIQQQGKHSAYYSNLPPGDYVLQVRGSNNHGLFSDVPVSVEVHVLPLWWQQRWVQYLILLGALCVGLVIHLYRLRHMQQINRLLQESVQQKAKAQLILETRVTERTQALEESSMTLSLRTRQLEKSLAEVAKANRELKRLDQLKDEFISTVSHELRTPLTSIRGAVGLVAQKVVVPGTDSYNVLLTTALQNCERLGQLINDLLDVQKFESGKFILTLKPLELADLCQQAVTGMQSYALRYQVSVVAQVGDDVPVWVIADALRLRQVLDNLLSNAVKFSHAQGVVTLRLTASEQQVRLDVQDHGQGIPQQFQRRVFEKFSQADASDSRAKEGTGLGLTICKKIVESHGGEIWFESQEGVGSTFSVSLLRTHAPAETD